MSREHKGAGTGPRPLAAQARQTGRQPAFSRVLAMLPTEHTGVPSNTPPEGRGERGEEERRKGEGRNTEKQNERERMQRSQ